LADDDARLAFVYQEAMRGLQQQQAAVESLHNRAATLVFAASFASSLLGSRALANGLGAWDWIAVALLLAIGVLTVILLWPYYNLSFRFDPEDLLENYVDKPVPMGEMHRSLALRAKGDFRSNGQVVHRLRETFQVALVLLVLEIMAWMFSIARAG
jgi:heme A synthase